MKRKVISLAAAVVFALAALGGPALAQDQPWFDKGEACWGQSVAFEATEYGPGYIGCLVTWAKDAGLPFNTSPGNADIVQFFQDLDCVDVEPEPIPACYP